ncbi:MULTISPECIES: DUF4157 domain-containing protein [unclassified Microbulbifer]|uniref:eCIS core domain-containing protein n=1 Tax=unclassified Microbulbifer TaxID=2619833 RepID=UPI0027E48B94|nr:MULTISPECIES: DUF4157 domain-containing protein [unclassified Microbulbifer]
MGNLQAKAGDSAAANKTSPAGRSRDGETAAAERQFNPLWQGMATGARQEETGFSASQSSLVQRMCAECAEEEEEEQQEAAPVQRLCSECAEEEREGEAATQFQIHPVQMWDCHDYGPPTCSVQAKCASCDQELVQHRSSAEGQKRSPGAIQRIASEGLSGANQPLPHGEQIQASFGRHDISGVRTSTGGAAGRASEQMGALAYTSSDRIAFRQSPDLRLSAHEAAHTVQQRSGLKLPGNVGRPGDRWERHADRVADAVVAGESAEPLLNEVAPGPGRAAPAKGDGISGAVQHQITSIASHRVESPVSATGGIGGEAAGEKTEGAASGEVGGKSESGEQAAGQEGEQAAETEAAAESPAAEQAEPEAACEAAEGEEGGEAAPAAGQPAAGAGGEGEGGGEGGGEDQGRRLGECYNAASPPRSEDAEEPEGDAPPNDVQEESEVSFPEWEEPNDACECEVGEELQQTAEQIPTEVAASSGGESVATAQAPTGGEGEHRETEGGEAVAAETGGMAAGEGGGTGGGEGGEGEGGDMTGGGFLQGEAARDAAIEDYTAASEELGSVPGRAALLSRGLVFAGAQRGSAADEVRRATALATIGAFMQGAAAQVQQAVAFVQFEVPARLGGMAEATKAAIEDSMAEQRAAISARIAVARNLATGTAIAARAHVAVQHVASVARVNAETDAAIASLQAAYTGATESIARRETTALGEVNSRFSTGRENHEAKGVEYGNRAIRRGQEHVDHYEGCKRDRNYADDGFWDGCLSVRRYHAQQKAACKTASGFYKNMTETAQRKGYNLREQRTQYRCAVISGAGQSQSTLDSTIERLTSGLESGRAGTLAGLAQVRDMNLQAVDAALAATLQSLDRREREQRQAVNDSGYIQQLAVEQLAHSVSASLARSVGSAMTSLEITLAQLREQLTAGDAPQPEELAAMLAPAREGLEGGMGSLLGKMEEGASRAEMQLLNAGFNAAEALGAISSANDSATAEAEGRFVGQMTTLMGAATSSMGQLADKQVLKAQESAAQGADSMQQLAAGFESATEQIYTRVDEAIANSLSELVQDLDHMEGMLDGKIIREANMAASKEQPAWKDVVAVVLIVLVIIASIVVSVLTLGAGAPFLAVVLVGAIVGAITAGLIQVINNWAAGEEWDTGLVQAMVIGAVGGALGGAIGAGANGLAQAAVQGAVRAGASRAAQTAINVGVNLAGDMLSEGLSQGFAYAAYGQDFNWQGFVMAGGMSGASSLRARPGAGARPGTRGADVSAPAPRTGGADVGVPAAGGSSVRGAMADLGVGMGLAGAVELADVAMGGEFDASRFASSAASGAAGARAAARGAQGGPSRPSTPPTSRLGRARARLTDSAIGRFAGRAQTRAGGLRDRAFSRLEISDTSSASRRWGSTLKSAEDWFAGGAGGLLGRRSAPEAPGSARARLEEADSPTSRSTEEQTRTRSDSEVEAAAARSQQSRSRTDIDPRTPAKNLSDAELASSTTTRMRVGDTDHHVSARKPVDQVVCEVCSFACGRIKNKIDEIEAHLRAFDPDHPLLEGLDALRQRVTQVEEGIENASVTHRDVVDASAEIAGHFRRLGELEPRLGEALNHPARIVPETGAPHGRISTVDLGVDTGTRQVKPIENFADLDIPDGTPVLYVLRDRETGAVMKVGQTTMGTNSDARFGRYHTAGSELGIRLELEVTPIANLRGQKIEVPEGRLRAALEDQGHVMPWDYTKPHQYRDVRGQGRLGRLGREGPGVPFESLPSSKYSRLRREGYDWERGEVPSKGYLQHPSRHSGVQPTTPLDRTAEVLRDMPGATRAEQAAALGISTRQLRWRLAEWAQQLRDRGVSVTRR